MNEDAESDEILQDAVRSYGLKQQLSAIHKQVMPELRVVPPVRRMTSTFMKVAAVLIFAVFVSMLYLYMSGSGESLFASHYAPYSLSAVRGNEAPSATKTDFLHAQADLQNGNAQNAAAGFQKVIKENNTSGSKVFNDDAQYYLALSYLKAGETNKALDLLRQIHDDKNHLYHDQVSAWFLFRVQLLSYK